MARSDLKAAHLSLSQERLWMFQQRSNAYHAQCALLLCGSLDSEAFEYALHQIVAQHEILQTLFYSLPGIDTPLQVINQRQGIYCPIVDLQGLDPAEQTSAFDTYFTLQQEEPFDLVHGPLLRMVLFRLAPSQHRFLYNLPALCADETTLSQFAIQLSEQYDGHIKGEALTSEPLQYVAVSSWLKKLQEAESALSAREFWGKVDLGRLKAMSLPFEGAEDRIKRPDILLSEIFEPRLHRIAVEEEQSARIATLAHILGVSREALLLAWWSASLWRLTGETRLLVGVASDGRNYEELSRTLGLFTRFVPVDTSFETSLTFKQAVVSIEASLNNTVRWQAYFTDTPEQASGDTEQRRPIIFPATFEYGQWPAALNGGELSISLTQRAYCVEPFALKLRILCVGEQVHPELHYDPRCLTSIQVHRLSGTLEQLLQSVLESPEAPLGSLSILDSKERDYLIKTFRGKEHEPDAELLYWRFEEQADQHPEYPAVVSEHETLTYRELNLRANQLARLLRQRGVGPNVRVGLCLERSAQMVSGLLAIWKAGGAYIALDPQNPPARLADQLQDAEVQLVLSQPALHQCLERWGGAVLEIAEAEAMARALPETNLSHSSQPQDEAYVNYTSGSTGKSKGVIITQQGVMSYTRELCNLLHVEPGWRFITVSTLAADLGNTAIFGALASAGCVLVPDHTTVMSGEAFARWMERERGDVLKIVPSHLAMLLSSNLSETTRLPERALVLGGEVLPPELLERLEQLRGNCEVYNHYGPTEATVGVLANRLGRVSEAWSRWYEQQNSKQRLPLGEPLGHVQLYILDRWGNLVPEEVTGEIYIGGTSLAQGYVGQYDQTAGRFVPNPFGRQAGERLYRTGDLGYYTDRKQIAYVGRLDGQVKVRGYRVELEEIEAVLRGHPNVRNCVVLQWNHTPGESQLRGYILARQQPPPTSEELKNYLRAFIPEYMLPHSYLPVKELPLTPNGKIDRHLLLAQNTQDDHAWSEKDQSIEVKTLIGPRDEIELRLVQIWEELLQTQPVTILDNFFDKGGHSILAVSLIARIRKQFGLDLPLAILFEHKTINDLAVVLRQKTRMENPTLISLQPNGSKPPFFCVHPSGGTAFHYIHLARHLGTDQPFYGLQTPDLPEGGWRKLEEMAAHYITAIKAVQPQGPYLLGGWSSGGIVALEMAQQLYEQGYEVPLLAIFDSGLSNARKRERAVRQEIRMDDTEVVKEVIRHFKLSTPDDFYQRDLEIQLDDALKQAREIHGIPVDADLELVRQRFSINRMNSRLAALYVPREYQRRIDYFLCDYSAEPEESGEDQGQVMNIPAEPDRLSPWREIAQGGLEVHPIPGNHSEMVEEPNVQILAEVLQRCIEKSL